MCFPLTVIKYFLDNRECQISAMVQEEIEKTNANSRHVAIPVVVEYHH